MISNSPETTYQLGEALGAALRGGEVILLTGGLGAGKTLFTKGVLNALRYDVDEVTSPSFTLVNLYRTESFDVYHIDLWRSEGADAGFSVGLDEIIEEDDRVVIIEWAERLGSYAFHSIIYRVDISGDGDDPRQIDVSRTEQISVEGV